MKTNKLNFTKYLLQMLTIQNVLKNFYNEKICN